MSPAHFYESNSSLLKALKGLSPPRKEDDATFVDVEPVSLLLITIAVFTRDTFT